MKNCSIPLLYPIIEKYIEFFLYNGLQKKSIVATAALGQRLLTLSLKA